MLIEFYGQDCIHCQQMQILVEKLERECGVKIEKYEVSRNRDNARKLEKYDQGLCGGVPFFFNEETYDFVCGATSFERLKEWADVK